MSLKQDPALRARLAEQGKAKADSVFNVTQHFGSLRELLTP